MGAFNTVKFLIPGRDGCIQAVVVQFKYGEVWQHAYNVGDKIVWGRNNIGDPTYKKVVVDGCIESPDDFLCQDFEVHIYDGKIESVIPYTGNYNFMNAGNTYIIIQY